MTDTLPTYTLGEPMWHLIPPGMIGGLRRYIEHGIPPGHFMTAVLSNDLMEALKRADNENINRLPDYGMWLYNCAPTECYGSPQKVEAWIKKGGLNTMEKNDDETD
jgi:hypothetical protein